MSRVAAPPIARIEAVTTLVRDADGAAERFAELGFPLEWTGGGGDDWQSAAISMGNVDLEFMQPRGEDGTSFFHRALESRGEGLFMIAFRTKDIDAAVADLRERGVGITDPVFRQGMRQRFRFAFVPGRFTPGVQSFLAEYESEERPTTEGGVGPLKVKKLDHVVIAVEDLEDALAKWETNVGLKPDASLDHPLGSGFKVSRLPIGESFLELVQPVEEKGRFYEQVQERGEGLFSISIEVEDLEAAVSHLRSKGAMVSDPEPSIWPGAKVARVNQGSAHGVSIQLIQRS